MNIGEKIHQIRKLSGMTQEELAEKMNVSRQTVSKWETGASAPDLENAIRLCELFQISLNDFMRGGQSMEQETKITLQDIIKLNRRSRQMTVTLIGGLFFLMIGALSTFFIGALYHVTGNIEYMLYRFIAVGEYAYLPISYWRMVAPAFALIFIGVILCGMFIWEKWREKKNER